MARIRKPSSETQEMTVTRLRSDTIALVRILAAAEGISNHEYIHRVVQEAARKDIPRVQAHLQQVREALDE